jgi:flavodoxin
MNKILVVYYSRTGRTKKVAEAIAAKLGADIEEIVDTTPRKGLRAIFHSTLDGLFNRTTDIKEPVKDPYDYDLIVVGTPIWAGSVCAPVRDYFTWTEGTIRKTAFFLTHGSIGEERVFHQMEALSGAKPLEVLALHRLDLWRNHGKRGRAKIDAFADKLLKRMTPVKPVMQTAA